MNDPRVMTPLPGTLASDGNTLTTVGGVTTVLPGSATDPRAATAVPDTTFPLTANLINGTRLNAHGYAFISDLAAVQLAQGYLALVMDAPAASRTGAASESLGH